MQLWFSSSIKLVFFVNFDTTLANVDISAEVYLSKVKPLSSWRCQEMDLSVLVLDGEILKTFQLFK